MSGAASDKHYWHRYTDTYEAAFAKLGSVTEILEFGVFRGESIAWLAERFPHARIVGVDIVPDSLDWPRSDRIDYIQLDQGDRAAIQTMFAGLGRRFDLIIEDGSHIPQHQAACLIEGLPHVRSGGLYVLEDIHTSHPDNAAFAQYLTPGAANSLHALLAIEHLKTSGRPMTPHIAAELASSPVFTSAAISALFDQIAALHLYRRSLLPVRCYACASADFDYSRLTCRCGVALYSSTDSMSALITRA
jgi:predicted O-methyltransferase YrrM